MIFDRKRAAGLTAATGDIIALTEDQVVFDPHWCACIVKAHKDHPHGAIGGAVQNGGAGRLHQALYLCDFGRYGKPFEAGEVRHLTDQNVSYKRAAIEKIRQVWKDSYHETAVHDALRAAGERLWLTPDCVVYLNRQPLGLRQQLRERYAWGRVFGGTRAIRVTTTQRMMLLAASPILPLLIVWRLLKRGSTQQAALSALVPVVAYAFAWSFGETTGYATAQPFPDVSSSQD